jgi:D-alanyl-D-alanine carboxypeptidase (penicillin-binding protein 5/6)
MMNTRAKELGMENTNFVNCTGLDDEPDAADHKTSAYDIALMSRELMTKHPDIQKYTTIWMDTVRNGEFGLSNTNKLIRFYKGATGLKTGFTSGAGYCLSATAQRDELHLVAVVMGCATSKERLAACKQLLDYGFANYALVVPETQEDLRVPVVLGKADSVKAELSDRAPLLVDKGQRNAVTTQVELEPEIKAPVRKGQRLGTLTVRSGEQILKEIPMVATESVEKLGYWDIFVQVLKRFVMAKV